LASPNTLGRKPLDHQLLVENIEIALKRSI
jgi:hypothetical protein